MVDTRTLSMIRRANFRGFRGKSNGRESGTIQISGRAYLWLQRVICAAECTKIDRVCRLMGIAFPENKRGRCLGQVFLIKPRICAFRSVRDENKGSIPKASRTAVGQHRKPTAPRDTRRAASSFESSRRIAESAHGAAHKFRLTTSGVSGQNNRRRRCCC